MNNDVNKQCEHLGCGKPVTHVRCELTGVRDGHNCYTATVATCDEHKLVKDTK